jgi:integrase
LARIRRRDVDLEAGRAKFVEKGRKPITKPIPDEFLQILRAAEAYGVWASPEAYLIPNRRPGAVRRPERSDKVIWNTVKIVAARAGVEATTHALRAAFAVQFDEENPDQLIALKELMGHARIETTLVYLRRKGKARAMETVRSLSWGRFVFPPQRKRHTEPRKSEAFLEEAHTGFEPVLPP